MKGRKLLPTGSGTYINNTEIELKPLSWIPHPERIAMSLRNTKAAIRNKDINLFQRTGTLNL